LNKLEDMLLASLHDGEICSLDGGRKMSLPPVVPDRLCRMGIGVCVCQYRDHEREAGHGSLTSRDGVIRCFLFKIVSIIFSGQI